MAKYKLGEIAPIQQGIVPKSDTYWLLNLDKVESNTGNILEYLYVMPNKIGASTISFDTNNILHTPTAKAIINTAEPLKPVMIQRVFAALPQFNPLRIRPMAALAICQIFGFMPWVGIFSAERWRRAEVVFRLNFTSSVLHFRKKFSIAERRNIYKALQLRYNILENSPACGVRLRAGLFLRGRYLRL